MGPNFNIGGYEKFAAFIQTHASLQFIHLQSTDYTSTVGVRTLTLRHFQSLVDIGLPLINRDPGRPAGQCFLLPDFNTVHLYLDHTREHAVVFCYFGNATPLREELGLSFRVGFELEFSAVQLDVTNPNQKAEVHASSGLRAIESFMLPLLSDITRRLELVANVPVEQFHCGGSDNAYELVLGHLPPLEAVDGLVTAKETTRRVCRENGVQVLFNPAPPEINGLHTNISIQGDGVEKVEESFLAGVIEHLGALCAFAMPRPESYARIKAGQWKRGSGCWEIRLPDASAQMYLFMAGVLAAGMEGVRRGLELRVKDCQVDVAMLTDEERLELGVTEQLPTQPGQAFQLLLNDELLMGSIGEELLTMYVTIQELYNKKLDEAGPEGSEPRKAWLMARI
ncbi:hypothetical protein QBC40DRAFT_317520 [Triangularia verruculosa]|uniref:GS catalytic domain-containing protein n=1 Tax=Triangularia verruculosa TaxID=2587418 RepID=A0AAN6X6T0_9PEZI|nr:hypothetical protein QBC40DRAFT_317520 [Triangularia verruculosa]